jgi:hypothetical protein
MRAILLTLLVACSSNTSHSVDAALDSHTRTCTGAVYDPCATNDQCMSMNCHFYNQSALTICTTTCTPLDNSTCPVDSTGAHGTCNNMGNCKPAAANNCVP